MAYFTRQNLRHAIKEIFAKPINLGQKVLNFLNFFFTLDKPPGNKLLVQLL